MYNDYLNPSYNVVFLNIWVPQEKNFFLLTMNNKEPI